MIRSVFRLTMLAAASFCGAAAFAQQTNPATATPQVAAAENTPLLRYVPDEILLAAAVRPQRLLTDPGLQEILQAAAAADLPQLLSQYTAKTVGLEPLQIAELILVLDQPTARLRQPQQGSGERVQNEFMQMQAVASAMTQFYDEHGFFPDDDGFGKSKG
ncbi:MAG: hypothetical protein ACKPJD_34285, partial [Planctomycetaceae bacterium]